MSLVGQYIGEEGHPGGEMGVDAQAPGKLCSIVSRTNRDAFNHRSRSEAGDGLRTFVHLHLYLSQPI